MNKRRKTFVIVLLPLFLAILFLSGCPVNQMTKPFSQMTPKEKGLWMFDIYNAQYSDYMAVTGHSWNPIDNAWKKTSSPKLNESQRDLLKQKRKILKKVYPLMSVYNSAVSAGGTPSPESEQAIYDLLNQLQGM